MPGSRMQVIKSAFTTSLSAIALPVDEVAQIGQQLWIITSLWEDYRCMRVGKT